MGLHFWISLTIVAVVLSPHILAESKNSDDEVDVMKNLEIMKENPEKELKTVKDEEKPTEIQGRNRKGRFINFKSFFTKDSQSAENQAVQYVQAVKIPEHMRDIYSRRSSQRSIDRRGLGSSHMNSENIQDIFDNGVIENSKRLIKYRKNIINEPKKQEKPRNTFPRRPDAFTSSLEITTFRPYLPYPITNPPPYRSATQPFIRRERKPQVVTVSPDVVKLNRQRISNVIINQHPSVPNRQPSVEYDQHSYEGEGKKGNFNIVRARPSLISSYREVPSQDSNQNVMRHNVPSTFVDDREVPIENKQVFQSSKIQKNPVQRLSNTQFNNQRNNPSQTTNLSDLKVANTQQQSHLYPRREHVKEPIFQDPRTHPQEVMYYNALEDEIRMSKFLTDSVRMVSSDSFDDLINETLKNKNKKNKVEKAEQIVPTKIITPNKKIKKISAEKLAIKAKINHQKRKKLHESKEKGLELRAHNNRPKNIKNYQINFEPLRETILNDYNYEYDSYPTSYEYPIVHQSRLVSRERIPGTDEIKNYFEFDKIPKIDREHFIFGKEIQQSNEIIRPTFSIPQHHLHSKEYYFHEPSTYMENNRRETKLPSRSPNHHYSTELKFHQPDDTHEVDFLDNLYIDDNYNFNDYMAPSIDVASRRAWGSHPIHHFMDEASDVRMSQEKLKKPSRDRNTIENVYRHSKENRITSEKKYNHEPEIQHEDYHHPPPHLETKYFSQLQPTSSEYDPDYFGSPESMNWNSGVKQENSYEIDPYYIKKLMEAESNNKKNNQNLKGDDTLRDYSRVYDESEHTFTAPKTLQRLFDLKKAKHDRKNQSYRRFQSSYEFDPDVFTSMPEVDYSSRTGVADYKITESPKLLSKMSKSVQPHIKKPEYIPSITIRDLAAAPSLFKAFSKKVDSTKLPEIVVTDSKEHIINTFDKLKDGGTSDGTFPTHGYNIDEFFTGFPSFGYFDSTLDN